MILRASRHTSEKELGAYTQQFVQQFEETLSFIHAYPEADPKLQELCYDQALFYKGFLLNAASGFRQLAISDSTTQEQFLLWKSYHRRLAQIYAGPLDQRQGAVELEEKANILEKELVKTVAGFGKATQQFTWKDVQSKLKPGEAAIEFVHYQMDPNSSEDSIMYAALVVKPNQDNPHFISLFEESDLESIHQNQLAYRGNALAGTDRGVRPRKNKENKTAQLNWNPLIEALQDVEKIYYASSGLMHRINLAAVMMDGKESFSDKFELVQFNSTRTLAVSQGKKSYNEDALLFGGIQYDLVGAKTERISSDQDLASLNLGELDIYQTTRSLRGNAWNYLTWTEREISSISNILQKSGIETKALTKLEGSEEAFRKLGESVPSPRVLHIATHGFFFPDPHEEMSFDYDEGSSQLVFKLSDHPMIRSGLVLAGANHVWAGNPPLKDREDGILTAYEISQMDLSATELVVLSACETGLGDIEGNEGVYGLQRAFQMAGAKYLIMSLWQVPDKETMEFMKSFYQNWLEEEMSIPVAFRETQKIMRKKYKDPYVWAAFVLVE